MPGAEVLLVPLGLFAASIPSCAIPVHLTLPTAYIHLYGNARIHSILTPHAPTCLFRKTRGARPAMDLDGGQTPEDASTSELISPIGESIKSQSFLFLCLFSLFLHDTCGVQCLSLARGISIPFGKVSALMPPLSSLFLPSHNTTRAHSYHTFPCQESVGFVLLQLLFEQPSGCHPKFFASHLRNGSPILSYTQPPLCNLSILFVATLLSNLLFTGCQFINACKPPLRCCVQRDKLFCGHPQIAPFFILRNNITNIHLSPGFDVM